MCSEHDWAHLMGPVALPAEATSEATMPTTARPAGHPALRHHSDGGGIGPVDLLCWLLGHVPSLKCRIVPDCWECSRCGRHTRRVS